jgi:hypothetical protein
LVTIPAFKQFSGVWHSKVLNKKELREPPLWILLSRFMRKSSHSNRTQSLPSQVALIPDGLMPDGTVEGAKGIADRF